MLAQARTWHTEHSPIIEQTTFGYSLLIMMLLLTLGNAVIINSNTHSKRNSLFIIILLSKSSLFNLLTRDMCFIQLDDQFLPDSARAWMY